MTDPPQPVADPATDRAGAGNAQATVVDPTQTHQVAAWKYDSPLQSSRFDPQGRFVFAGAQDNTVQRWDLESGERTTLAGHQSWVRSIAFLSEGATLLTAGYDGRLLWWPTAAKKPEPIRTVAAHKGWIRAMAVSPDGRLIATVGNDRLVKLWDAIDGTPVHELAGHGSHVYNVAFHPGGEFLISADLKLEVKQWRIADGKPIRTFAPAKILHKYDTGVQAHLGGARSIAFSPDGDDFVLGGIVVVATNIFDGGAGSKPTAVLVDWKTGKRKLLHQPQHPLPAVLWGAWFHPAGFLIGASGGAIGGHLFFWKRNAAHEFFQLKLPSAGRDLALHPDLTRLAVPQHDQHLRIYSMSAKEPA